MTRAITLSLIFLLSAGTLTAQETAEGLRQKGRLVLSPLEGEIPIPGLKAPVEVLRDRWGVPHIYAKNQHDLFFAQGLVVAQDRLFQLELWRRLARGETAELFGKARLATDRLARLLRYRGDEDKEWKSYGPDARDIATSFVHGINAWIDHIGDKLPIEFQLLQFKPGKWQPQDVLGRMSGIIMTRNFTAEVARAELINAVGLDKARKLAPTDPPRDFAPAQDLDLAGIDRSVLADYEAAVKPLEFKLGSDGSNNWVVSGKRSSSGKPLLASDPHRAITLPSLRYLVHLSAPGWNVIGSGEPGLPGVALGHNERIAWGFTIVGTDQADLYVEETKPDDPRKYRVGDGWAAMEVVKETIAVKGQEPIEIELRFTRHGPILHEDHKRHRAYALRWVGSEPGGAAYLGCLDLGRAGSAKEFLTATKSWRTPSENIVFADVDGNIGWIAAAGTPIRQGWDGLLPVPGTSGKYEWKGYREVSELPQSLNPSSGFIATANHNILPPKYPFEISYEWAGPFRFHRVREVLQSKDVFELADFQKLQHDEMSLLGKSLVQVFRQVEIKDPALRVYAELLANWDGRLPRSANPGPIYALWLQELTREFFKLHVPEKLVPIVTGNRGLELMVDALTHDHAWFGKDGKAGRDALVRRTFAAAVDRLNKNRRLQGPWGDAHRAIFQHPLSPLGKAHAQAFDLEPVPRGGDANTVNNTRHDDNFRQLHGASYRHLFDLADWDRGLATSVPGQSGQPESPHYADLLSLWANGDYFPLVYSRQRVEKESRHRLVLRPGD